MMTSRAAVLCVLAGLLVAVNLGHAAPSASSSGEFVLLHSVLGYERLGTKHALIRATTASQDRRDAINLATSRAWLASADGGLRIFPIRYAGKTFGSNWWLVDFSSFRKSGTAFRLLVTLVLAESGKVFRLQSTTFEIGDDILFKRTFAGLALENSRARKAPPTMGGGYFDCNTEMGEAYSHAMFAAGLLEVLERRSDALSDGQKQELVNAAEVSLNYVAQLQQRDGRIVDQHSSRPFQGLNPGLVNTTIGAYGLARAAGILKAVDDPSANRYLNAASRAFQYLDLRTSGPDMVILGTLMYRASGNRDYLDIAAAQARFILESQRSLPAGEQSLEALPYNEGLMDLVQLAPEHPDWLLWVHYLLDYGTTLYSHAPSRNVFHISPWDNIGLFPEELISFQSGRTSHLSRVAYSALRLSELFPNFPSEPIATASLQWVAGLNYGLPGDRVLPGSTDPVVSASFITNLGSRYAKQLTAEHQWRQPTIVNGFTEGFRYENTWQASETFILHDGLWLMAMSRYAAPARMTVETTCSGRPCSAHVRAVVGGKAVDGETAAETGKATVFFPAAGGGELTISREGRHIVIPLAALMGARLRMSVDLHAHVFISLGRTTNGARTGVVLKLRNVGSRGSRVHFRVRAQGGRLSGPTDVSLFIGAGRSHSWLIELVPSSSTYVVASDVGWEFGHDRVLLYAPVRERTCGRQHRPAARSKVTVLRPDR